MLIASREMMSLPDETPPAPAEWWGLYLEARTASATVGMQRLGSPPSVTLEYSVDNGESWSQFAIGTTTVTLTDIGDRVYFRSGSAGNTAFSNSSPWSSYHRFTINGNAAVGGNIISLLSQTEGTAYPATTGNYTFCRLFERATTLIDASDLVLPTNTVINCYRDMFNGCSALAAAPDLPATTMTNGCYQGMFYGCRSLTVAPDLPATTLDAYCYGSMFYGCSSLATAPALPATTLAQYCYGELFYGCSSLTTAPSLPATTMVSGCYERLFYNCSSLASITTKQTSFDGCTNWVNGVAASGTFICDTTALGDASTISRGTSACPSGWSVRDLTYWGFYVEAQTTGATVAMQRTRTPPSATLEYSTDAGETWSPFAIGTTTVTLAAIGDKVYFRAGANGNTAFSNSSPWSNYHKFVFSGSVAVGGNITSLLSQTDTATFPVSAGDYTFCRLFNGATGLVDASHLILPSDVKGHCYRDMLNGCSGLTAAPALPATTLADNCYSGMFIGTASLTTPPALPATTLAPYCYDWMFADGSAITSAPALPATTLASYCYEGMFKGCTGLTSAPTLPATTLTTGCYTQMFLNCSNLTAITTAQTSFTGCGSWVSGVAASGNFNCPAELGDDSTITRGVSACPVGWSVGTAGYWGMYIEARTANSTVVLSNNSGPTCTFEYSTDSGATWSAYTLSTTLTLAAVGDRVYFRSGVGGNTRLANYDYNYHQFQGTGDWAVGGNIMSLLSQTEITEFPTGVNTNFAFCRLFYGVAALKDASDLIMPATTLSEHCYQYMFQGSLITGAPHLPAATLADACYAYMFAGCSQLTAISTEQTGFYNNFSACYDWVANVSASGTFECPSALGTDSTIARGSSECPSGWTVINT